MKIKTIVGSEEQIAMIYYRRHRGVRAHEEERDTNIIVSATVGRGNSEAETCVRCGIIEQMLG